MFLIRTSPFNKLRDLEICCLSGQLQILDFVTSKSQLHRALSSPLAANAGPRQLYWALRKRGNGKDTWLSQAYLDSDMGSVKSGKVWNTSQPQWSYT